MATLNELQAYEAKLIKAMGDPLAEVWYDEFKKKNRPISELKDALAEIRKQIAKVQGQTRSRHLLPRAVCDL